jgi:hypothetical protein
MVIVVARNKILVCVLSGPKASSMYRYLAFSVPRHKCFPEACYFLCVHNPIPEVFYQHLRSREILQFNRALCLKCQIDELAPHVSHNEIPSRGELLIDTHHRYAHTDYLLAGSAFSDN